ncbi:MAG: hypothetical protein K2X66_13105 [Cyanobacteria bacterium]|nr:hypothetical protein [Cyanobacteriota bacterium]
MKKNKFYYFLQKEQMMIRLGVFLGLIGIAVYLTGFYVPFYESEMKLYIRNIPKDNINTSYGAGGLVKSESGFSNPLFNYIEVLDSEKLGSRVLDILRQKYPDDVDRLSVDSKVKWAKIFTKITKAKVIPSTDIVKVSFQWDDPDHLADVFNIVIDEYKATNLEIRKETDTKRLKYLEGQLDLSSQRLDEIREEIKKFRVDNKASDLTQESLELTKARVELEKEAEELKSQISFSKSNDLSHQLGMKDAQTGLRASGIGEDPYLVKLSQDLAVSQQKYAKLTAKLTDQHPDTVEVKNEIDSLKSNIETRKREIMGSVGTNKGLYDTASITIATDLARVQADGTSQISQLKALQQGINNLAKEEQALPLKRQGLMELEKKEKALALAYENVYKNYEEAKIKERQIDDNIVVLNHPSKASFAWLELLIVLIALLGLGTLSGLAVAWIKYDIEDKWLNSEEIELFTGKNVLGVIPWVNENPESSSHYIEPFDSILGISYSKIVNNIISRSYLKEAQLLSFISTSPLRKNSPVIHNMVGTLTRLGKSVILLDVDFTNPGKLLTATGNTLPAHHKDLIDIIQELNYRFRLSGEVPEEEVRQLIEDSLFRIEPDLKHPGNGNQILYLSSLKTVENVYDYVGSRGFQTIIAYLRAHYEFILIDPPNKPYIYPEIQAITNLSDAMVIVTSLQSNRQDLIKIIDDLDRAEKTTLGVISREKNSKMEKDLAAGSHQS